MGTLTPKTSTDPEPVRPLWLVVGSYLCRITKGRKAKGYFLRGVANRDNPINYASSL